MDIAHREIFFEIQYGWIIYILAVLSVAFLIYSFYRRSRLWKLGLPDSTFTELGKKTKAFIYAATVDGIIHRKIIFKDLYPGIIHALIFYGALLLLLGTAMDVISHYIVEFLHGNTYLAISFLADLGGVMLIIGVIMVAIRRYIQKPDRLDNIPADGIALVLILIIVLTGFILEGLRIVVTAAHFTELPVMEWAQWSFLGFGFAKAFESCSNTVGWYQALWWFHSLLIIGTIVYIALDFPKLTHMVVAPVNAFFRSTMPKGALRPIELEEAETFGAANIQDFTFKDLLDMDSCTRCGRCQDNCPAYLSGKPLSPKKLVQDLKNLLTERQGSLFSAVAVKDPPDNGHQMIGEVITEDEIWACTTCRACQEQCPVFIEPINKIIEMRRNLVLEQTQFPETAMGALRSMEQRGHPWRGTMAARTDWADGMDIKLLSDDSNVDVLFWVGCTAALEERNMKVAKAVAKVLQAAGVNFGILGTEESCCGEPARRIGNEYLFQMLAQQNIETLKGYGVTKIVTACPHGYNTIKNEYPQFGGHFEVWHHTEFIADLLKQGKLTLARSLDKKTTYHDSCYLGRYNDIYEAPREILQHVTGTAPVEMEHQKSKAFCCGGGGGRMWMEEQIGKRMNQMRAEEAIKVNAEVLASACPFCIQMFEDGIKALEAEASLKTMDLAEIIAEALE
ncbi:MAG: heterodisulfide reductase-related iron-sulfur binding cluster [Dehalococcoidia bacterium]